MSNMVGFRCGKRVRVRVSRKVESLSTSAVVKTQEFHRVTPLLETGLDRSWTCKQYSETTFNIPEQVSTFDVTGCNDC